MSSPTAPTIIVAAVNLELTHAHTLAQDTLATPRRDMEPHYNVIIVGSGPRPVTAPPPPPSHTPTHACKRLPCPLTPLS
jgi:hypothetical protein